MVNDQRCIVTLIVVVWLRAPDTPCTVMVKVPLEAVLLAVNVRTLVVVAGFSENNAVTPAPMPVAERVTPPVKPPVG